MEAIVNLSTADQIRHAEQCPKHRVGMLSSESIYKDKYAERLGQDPIGMRVVYDCLSCVSAGRPLNIVRVFMD